MIQNFTLHTHTVGFDGRNTVAQMVNAAHLAHFHTIGISNHFIVYPGIENTPMFNAARERGYSDMYASSFDIALSRFVPHYQEIRSTKSVVNTLCGMEVDYFPGKQWRDNFKRASTILYPDYKIGSVHFVEYNGRLCNSHDVRVAHPDDQKQMVQIYWENVARAASSGLFNFMAHLDLIKKARIGTGAEWQPMENKALDAIADARVGIEINTSGFEICGDAYPSMRILRGAVKRDIPILLSDDAHSANRIGHRFMHAQCAARTAGVKKFATLEQILHTR